MTDASEAGLRRARQELDAAALLVDSGFPAQSVSRSYYAAFYAAEAALLAMGEIRAKHSGVIAAFGQVLVRDGRIDERAGRLLRSLFERRSQADYDFAQVPAEEARSALDDARFVVETIDAWFEAGSAGSS